MAYLSGSVGMLSEGIHSSLDVVSASLTFFTVKEAVKPADEDHPYGHGKIETLSSLFESLLLVAAAGFIVYEGVRHVLNPQPVEHQTLAIVTIIVATMFSYAVYLHNRSAAAETESTALHVNALHFLADVITNFGVLAGLILLKVTGWTLIDPIIAFGVAAYILFISARQVKHAILELSDTHLPESEVQAIRGLLDGFRGRIIEAHDLRTRKGGNTRHIDYHLVVCGQLSVTESHRVCDEMEEKIREVFPGASVNIHVEPCDAPEHEKAQCRSDCPYKGKKA